MDKDAYLSAIDRDAECLRTAALRGRAAAVSSCPGWTVAHVVSHVGRAYRWMADMVATRTRTPRSPAADDYGCDPAAPHLLDWFADGLTAFHAAFDKVDLSEPVWTWSTDQHAGFWLRLEAHETAIHRYDAQLAHNTAEPISSALARDGLDLTFDTWLPLWRQGSLLPSGNESYRILCTDEGGVWRVRFAPHAVEVTQDDGEAMVTLRGTASDLLLFLWRRQSASRLEVVGAAALVDRYLDLAPPR